MQTRTIFWTERASSEYSTLIDYLVENWSLKIVEEIVMLINSSIHKITNTPKQFPVIFPTKQIRRCVVSKQTSIFFLFSDNQITIISLFDNRQNPDKQPL